MANNKLMTLVYVVIIVVMFADVSPARYARHNHHALKKHSNLKTSSTQNPTTVAAATTLVTKPKVKIVPVNIIKVPLRCKEGEGIEGGRCRKQFLRSVREINDGPGQMAPACIINCNTCPEGQKPDINGICRPVWNGGDFQKNGKSLMEALLPRV